MPIQLREASWEEWDRVVSQLDRGSPPPQIVRGERRRTLSLEIGEVTAIMDMLRSEDKSGVTEFIALLETKIREFRGLPD